MLKKILLISFVILVNLCCQAQKKYFYSINFNYLVKPFNNFNFGEQKGSTKFYDFDINNKLNYQLGFSIAKIKKNHSFSLNLFFSHFSVLFETDIRNIDLPNYSIRKLKRKFVSNGIDLGFGYAKHIKRFEIGINGFINCYSKNKVEADFDFGRRLIIIPNVDSARYSFNIYETKNEDFVLNFYADFFIKYRYSERVFVKVSTVFMPNYGAGYTYRLLVSSDDLRTEQLEKKVLINRVLDYSTWLYPKVGIEFAF